MDWSAYVIAIAGSAIAGAINTLAGNGSAITLTILTEVLGLPPTLANGTNRVGVFTQSAASTFAFYRNGRLDLSHSKIYIAFTLIGAVAGALLATVVSNDQFRGVFRFLMVFMLLVTLVKPSRWLRETEAPANPNPWIAGPLFIGLGFYGGFIQMGMGIFFLAATVLGARFSLIDANVMKSVIVCFLTLIAIIIFQWRGLIDWKIGGLMAIGQTIGGYYTARFASRYPKANLWAYRLLIVMIIIAILMLFDLF